MRGRGLALLGALVAASSSSCSAGMHCQSGSTHGTQCYDHDTSTSNEYGEEPEAPPSEPARVKRTTPR